VQQVRRTGYCCTLAALSPCTLVHNLDVYLVGNAVLSRSPVILLCRDVLRSCVHSRRSDVEQFSCVQTCELPCKHPTTLYSYEPDECNVHTHNHLRPTLTSSHLRCGLPSNFPSGFLPNFCSNLWFCFCILHTPPILSLVIWLPEQAKIWWVAVGGLVVACLPLDPRFAGSNPAEDDRFLRAIKSVARVPSEGK
jgi:hypothetical protein